MKKIIIVLTTVCMLFAGHAAVFAENAAPDHDWVLLATIDGDEVYYDQAHYSYNKDTGIMDVWAKQTIKKPMLFFPREAKGIFTHFYMNVKTNKYARSEYNLYDENGKIIRHGNVNPNDWSSMYGSMKKIVTMVLEKNKPAETN